MKCSFQKKWPYTTFAFFDSVIVGDLVRALDPLLWIDIHTTTLEWAREALDLEQMSPSEKREGYTLDVSHVIIIIIIDLRMIFYY